MQRKYQKKKKKERKKKEPWVDSTRQKMQLSQLQKISSNYESKNLIETIYVFLNFRGSIFSDEEKAKTRLKLQRKTEKKKKR